jgi:hypothetical protein
VQPYPICYYSKKPSPEERAQLIKRWQSDIEAYLGRDAALALSPDERWLFARGLAGDHAALRKIWPRLGCVGYYQSALSYPYYSHCIELLQKMLDTRNYLLRGKESDFLNGFYGYCNGSGSTLATASKIGQK